MKNKSKTILTRIEKYPQFHKHFDNLYKKSSQVIIFGSHAADCQNENSDVDILFVTKEGGLKNEFFDFITIEPEKLSLKSWLGGELANHIAKYGIWLKGNDSWKHNVFVSQSSIDRKKIIILNRFSHLYVKHKSIKRSLMLKLFEDIVLDACRLILLTEGKAIPPTSIVRENVRTSKLNMLLEMRKEKYIGKVAEVFINELFKRSDLGAINLKLKSLV